MKIVYSGGINKHDPQSYQRSYFYCYSNKINQYLSASKQVAFVTSAKPDHYYDQHILPQFGNRVDIIGRKKKKVNWSQYHLIFLCGGTNLDLKKGLIKQSFKLSNLKPNAIILGDSAGAYLLSAYYFDRENHGQFSFHQGFNPSSQLITIAHFNDPKYTYDQLIRQIDNFARSHQLRVLKLNENQTQLLTSNHRLIDFTFD